MSLVEQVRNAGVVGAGGAGFPAHVKVGSQVEYVIANGAECEPLLHKDSELMARHAEEVAAGVDAVVAATGATTGIIGLKEKHAEAVAALGPVLERRPTELRLLGDFYPTGDEFVLVYEITGRLIPPGGIPLNVEAVVHNVESLYNIARAAGGTPVTRKFVTVAGAVARPVTCSVPVGTSFRDLLECAGGTLAPDCALLVGGAMMGRLTRDLDECVTKTTGGLITLPGDHPLVRRQERPEPAMHRIGKSACDQCTYCTEMCPRYLLGYDVEPHKVMRGLVFSLAGEESWNQWGMLCCECSLCTLYACPEELYPREACQRAKQELKPKEISWPEADSPGGQLTPLAAHPMYESRRIPLKQLVQRLGLTEYDGPAPFVELGRDPTSVRLSLAQHVGAPAVPVVQVGDRVRPGDLVAEIPEGALGARLHASIAGLVRSVDPEIVIDAG